MCSSVLPRSKMRRMQDITESLQQLVQAEIPGARVSVTLYAGDNHFDMQVISPAFAGKTRIAQHQMVYRALGEHMRESVHALALKTYTPERWQAQANKENS